MPFNYTSEFDLSVYFLFIKLVYFYCHDIIFKCQMLFYLKELSFAIQAIKLTIMIIFEYELQNTYIKDADN